MMNTISVFTISLQDAGSFQRGLHGLSYVLTLRVQDRMPGDKNEVPSRGQQMFHLTVTLFINRPPDFSVRSFLLCLARNACLL